MVRFKCEEWGGAFAATAGGLRRLQGAKVGIRSIRYRIFR